MAWPKMWKWWRRGAAVLISTIVLLAVIWLSGGPIQGCYLSPRLLVSEHEFLLFTNGNVFGIIETPYPIEPAVVNLGSYAYENGMGWVWHLRGAERRIICRPSLLFIRFSWQDGNSVPATEPFQWRDPYLWKTKRIMEAAKVRDYLSSHNTTGTVVPHHQSPKDRISTSGK